MPPDLLVRGFFVASSTNPRRSRTVQDSNRAALRSRVSNQPSGLLLSPRFPTHRNVYQERCRQTFWSGAFLLRHPLTHVRAGREPHLFSPQGFPLHFIEKCVSIKRAIRRSDAVRRWVQDVQNCDRRGSGRNTGKPEPVRPAICAGAGPAGGDQSHHRRCRDRRALYAGIRHYFYGRGDATAGRFWSGRSHPGRGCGCGAGLCDQHGTVCHPGLRGGCTGLCAEAGELLSVLHQAFPRHPTGAAAQRRAGGAAAGGRRHPAAGHR